MDVIFEYQHVTASERLEEFATEKLVKLQTKYPFLIRGDVFFKNENRSDSRGHICAIRLSAPGPRLYATSDEKTYEAAISETIRDLSDQLEKRKSMMKSH